MNYTPTDLKEMDIDLDKVSETEDIHIIMQRSAMAFEEFQGSTGLERAALLEKIAEHLEINRSHLINLAQLETHLPPTRLNGELTRTTQQLKLFAKIAKEGSWVEATIDHPLPDRKPAPRPGLAKMLIPKGPVAVFGASNFPFAFSTLGGDTASALAAGCSVVVKAHPMHLKTSIAAFNCAQSAIKELNMDPAILQHVFRLDPKEDIKLAASLVEDPETAAVGFTGSFKAGSALMRAAQQRPIPIEIFAEMSSTNPVVIMPSTLNEDFQATAEKIANSISLGVGQFCTNPGLLFLIRSKMTDSFLEQLRLDLSEVKPAPMLHGGILNNYKDALAKLLSQKAVTALLKGSWATKNGARNYGDKSGIDSIQGSKIQGEPDLKAASDSELGSDSASNVRTDNTNRDTKSKASMGPSSAVANNPKSGAKDTDLNISPTLASVTAEAFISNPALREEVFGPFSLIVICEDEKELLKALSVLGGQLTATILASKAELSSLSPSHPLIRKLTSLAGRLIIGQMPTGVEVSPAMMHGGPYPATSNSVYSSVGSSAILRWVRPVCFQDYPDAILPPALQKDNPLKIWRMVDGEWGRK